jgi:hypothetical protein
VKLFEETANLARLAALACVLAQDELSRSGFDRLAETEPLSLQTAASAPSAPASRDVPNNPRARPSRGYIDQISRAAPEERAKLFRAVSGNAAHIQEIQPKDGETLAKYLLWPKSDEEREYIASAIPNVGRWKLLRLAMADLMADTPLREDVACEVVGLVLGQEVEASGDEDWRRRLREMLMRSVLQGGEGSENSHPYDAAQDMIVAMYEAQANALDVPVTWDADVASPTAILPAMIEQLGSRLAGRAKSESDQAFLARLPHELTVAEYLGDDDLRRSALLERIWLRVLAIETAQVRSDRAAQAQAIADKLDESDRAAGDALLQLRNGQAALVQMWLLRAP